MEAPDSEDELAFETPRVKGVFTQEDIFGLSHLKSPKDFDNTRFEVASAISSIQGSAANTGVPNTPAARQHSEGWHEPVSASRAAVRNVVSRLAVDSQEALRGVPLDLRSLSRDEDSPERSGKDLWARRQSGTLSLSVNMDAVDRAADKLEAKRLRNSMGRELIAGNGDAANEDVGLDTAQRSSNYFEICRLRAQLSLSVRSLAGAQGHATILRRKLEHHRKAREDIEMANLELKKHVEAANAQKAEALAAQKVAFAVDDKYRQDSSVDTSTQNALMRKEIKTLHQQVVGLRKQVAVEAEKARQECEAATENIPSLEKRNSELNELLETAEKDRGDLEKAMVEMVQRAGVMEKQMSILRKKVENSDGEYNALVEEIREKDKEIEDLNQKLKDKESEMEAHLGEKSVLLDQRDQIADKLKGVIESMRGLTQEKEQVAQSLDETKKELLKLQEAEGELQAQVASKTKDAMELEDQMLDLRRKVHELETENSILKLRSDQLENEVQHSAQISTGELERIQEELAKAKADHENALKKCEDLQSDLKSRETGGQAQAAKIEALELEITREKANVANAEKTVSSVRAQAEASNEELEQAKKKAKEDFMAFKVIEKDLEEKLAQKISELDNAQKLQSDGQDQLLNAIRAKETDWCEKLRKLEESVTQLRKENAELSDVVAPLKGEAKAAKEEAATMKQELEKANEELANASIMKDRHVQELQAANDKAASAASEAADAKIKMSQLSEEVEALTKASASFEGHHEQSDQSSAKIEEMTARIQRLVDILTKEGIDIPDDLFPEVGEPGLATRKESEELLNRVRAVSESNEELSKINRKLSTELEAARGEAADWKAKASVSINTTSLSSADAVGLDHMTPMFGMAPIAPAPSANGASKESANLPSDRMTPMFGAPGDMMARVPSQSPPSQSPPPGDVWTPMFAPPGVADVGSGNSGPVDLLSLDVNQPVAVAETTTLTPAVNEASANENEADLLGMGPPVATSVADIPEGTPDVCEKGVQVSTLEDLSAALASKTKENKRLLNQLNAMTQDLMALKQKEEVVPSPASKATAPSDEGLSQPERKNIFKEAATLFGKKQKESVDITEEGSLTVDDKDVPSTGGNKPTAKEVFSQMGSLFKKDRSDSKANKGNEAVSKDATNGQAIESAKDQDVQEVDVVKAPSAQPEAKAKAKEAIGAFFKGFNKDKGKK